MALIKKKVKLEDGTEIEVYEIASVDAEVADITQKLNNRIEQVTRLNGEIGTLKAEVDTHKAAIATKDQELAGKATVDTENTSLKQKLGIFQIYAGQIPADTLKHLSDLPLFKDADIATDEGKKKLDEEVRKSFGVYFQTQDNNTADNKNVGPAGGGGGNANGNNNVVVAKVEDLKGKSIAEINAGLDQLKKK